MKDFAVVGSGIGGSSIAALLSAKGFDVVLFEKEAYLGGCSSSFSHKGHIYNTGATTLAGYETKGIVKDVFDTIGLVPEMIQTDPAIVVVHNTKVTPRFCDFEKFFAYLDANYPHEKNREFWTLIYEIDAAFYKVQGYYYSNASFFSKLKSLTSFLPLCVKFQKYLRKSAAAFIQNFFTEISEEYIQFMESQILIVSQAGLREINFFTAALSLGYTFHDTYYVRGGMSTLFDAIVKNVHEVHRNAEILSIEKHNSHYSLHTKQGVFEAKKIILNSTVYESAKLFASDEVKNYYKKYEKLDNYQSSFMLYMTIKSEKDFFHHYQLIEKEQIKYTLSNAVFVSFSDKDDIKIAPQGHYSITASIHTDSRFWEDKAKYKSQKKELESFLFNTITAILKIEKESVITYFSATPKTFKRYINRSQLGGNAVTMKNFLPFLPANDTPLKGLYNVGDSVYAAQGWSGVMLGVKNLDRLLDA
ncbi:MAG TPA: phytoene dehydrogenase [Sulfurimonas sp. UBA12504]|nr:MAG: phytoene dehydrogenase [Sulfurimonas sp. GWF2_37_8]DAB29127.1 MAG TPA: phytoene dehydrogenase [Sulfurimonas sp. UBA12504]